MTLDEAKTRFEENPTGETAADFMMTSVEYWLDDMISEDTHVANIDWAQAWITQPSAKRKD